MFFLGVTYALQGSDNQARTQLNRYARKYPNTVRVQQLLAALDLRGKDYDAASRRLAPVLKQYPDDLLTLKLMVNVAMKQGDTGAAVEYMRKVVAKEPGVAQSHLRLGLGLLVQGEQESGALELKQAIDLEADNKMADFVLVLSYLRDGKLDEALSSALAYTTKYPDSAMGWNLQGLVQIRQQQIDAARQSFVQALDVQPGDPGAANNLALLALKDGDVDKAIRLYETVLEERPGQMSILENLVKLLLRQGRLADARSLLEKKVAADPQALEPRVLLADIYLKQRENQKAVTLLLEIQDKYSDNPLFLGNLGHAQMEAGDLTNAVFNLQRLVQRVPRSALAYQMLYQAYDKRGDQGEMEKALDRALELDPGDYPSRVRKLKLLIEQAKLDEASQLLGTLQQEYPDNPQLQIEQARLKQAQGEPEEAVRMYQEMVKRAPTPDLVGQLALAQWRAGHPEAGIKTMQDWLKEHPKDQMVRYNLANLYMAAGQNDKASEAFAKVIEAYPTHTVALINLALLTREADPDKALAYARLAHSFAPKAPVVQDALAQILLDRGESREAASLLQQAVENAPNDPRIRYHWAQALVRNGETATAKRELDRILGKGVQFAGDDEARALREELSRSSE
jgi:putative PEP-CTERM system TPR-repeat lipoprotein